MAASGAEVQTCGPGGLYRMMLIDDRAALRVLWLERCVVTDTFGPRLKGLGKR